MVQRPESGIPSLRLYPDPAFVLDAEFRITWANPACETGLGRRLDDWLGQSAFELIHPDDVELALVRVATLEGKPINVRVKAAAGDWRYWELLATLLTEGEYAGGLLVSARDTTERHALEVAGEDVGLLRALVNHSSAMLAVVDPDGSVRSINAAFTRELGYNATVVTGSPYDGWIAERDRERVATAVAGLAIDGTISLDATMVHADGTEILVDFTVSDLSLDPAVGGLLVSGQVAHSLMAARQQASFLATHDLATGLHNRLGLLAEGAALERRAARTGEPLGVVLLDLDRLGLVNEFYGHDAGDAVIRSVAARLGNAVRPDDLVARYDGDEFVVAMCGPLDNLLGVRDRLLEIIAEPILMGDNEIVVTATAATANSASGGTVAELVEQASADLEHAHRFEPGGAPARASGLAERRLLVDQLHAALAHDELELWFQPIVDERQQVGSFEALLRWNHPERGLLAPAAFLPMVTAAGLQQRVDRLVINQAVAFAARLADCGGPRCVVHLNVTPGQVSTEGFGAELKELCDRSGVDLGSLCAEITESDVLRVGAVALRNLGELRSYGVHIAIDDFGTGFSSLAHLLELPVDMLKIDRRFVSGLGVETMATSLTGAILGLANSVGLECVAEGVETIEQRDALLALGCRQFQGWLYEAALPIDRALEVAGRVLVAGA